MMDLLLEVDDLKKYFPVHGGVLRRKVAQVYAVDGVTFAIGAGETLGLVGESGCGKTTVGRCVLRLYPPTDGKLRFMGADLLSLGRAELRAVRRNMQMIFQDPFESLNSRHTVQEILEEPFVIHRSGHAAERRRRARQLLIGWGCPGGPCCDSPTSSAAVSASGSVLPAPWPLNRV